MFASRRATALAVALGILSAAAAGKAATPSGRSDIVRVGLAKSLVQGLPGASGNQSGTGAAADGVGRLVEEQTGIATRFTGALDHDHLGQLLAAGDIQLGLFHGVEFAWAKQKYPGLRPLLVLVNETPYARACLVVRRGDGVADFADLKGKACALPAGSRQHCRLFLEARCRQAGAEPKDFFSRLDPPRGVNDAVEAVVEGTAQAAVVDERALDCYRELKPGRFARLEVAQRSEVFPAAVLAYADGNLSGERLRQVRQALLRAARQPRTHTFLTVCHLTGLAEVPEDYDQTLQDIAAAYQPPARPAVLDWLTAGLPGLNAPAKKPAEKAASVAPEGGR